MWTKSTAWHIYCSLLPDTFIKSPAAPRSPSVANSEAGDKRSQGYPLSESHQLPRSHIICDARCTSQDIISLIVKDVYTW